MFLSDNTVDDLLNSVLKRLLIETERTTSSRGAFAEVFGVLLRLDNPRARLSVSETKGKLFSCIGELIWYLAGSNRLDFITHYIKRYAYDSEDNETIHGAYGPRFFNFRDAHDQIANVIALLKHKPTSRRAVIQLFDADDISVSRKEIPCTCSLQFSVRKGRLDMMTHMRSNDALLGMPHDFFAFTMIQELVARSLDVDLGMYFHSVGSLHLYDEMRQDAERYLAEGLQDTVAMPPMPPGDQWQYVTRMIELERSIRLKQDVDVASSGLPDYWMHIGRLLQFYTASQLGDTSKMLDIHNEMQQTKYSTYLLQKLDTAALKRDRDFLPSSSSNAQPD